MEYVTLKDISHITMGQSPDSSSYNSNRSGLPFFQGNADFGELYPTVRVWCSDPKKIAHKGDILISVRAPIGALNYANTDCCIGRGLAAITIKDPITKNYVFHLLRARNGELNNKGTGSTFKAINKSVLEDLLVPVVTSEEAEYRMKLMDISEDIIRKRKQELSHCDTLIKSRFVEMFGDPVINNRKWDFPKIKDVVANEKNAIKAGPFGSDLKKEYYVPSGYKIYGQEQVISGDPNYGDYYISEDRYKKLKNCKVQSGDVLISLVGTYGKLLIIPDNFQPGIINPRLMKITFNKELVNPVYFKYFFQSDSLKKSLMSNTHGGTMDILNLGIVKNLNMPLPPLKLQNQFSDFVHQVDKSKLAIQKSLDETQLLFDSLMQEYFG